MGDSVRPQMNTIASRDQLKPITVRESLVVNYIENTPWKMRAYNFYSRVEKYRKTNQLAQRMSEFPDTLEPVNKNRIKHFPSCYLFI